MRFRVVVLGLVQAGLIACQGTPLATKDKEALSDGKAAFRDEVSQTVPGITGNAPSNAAAPASPSEIAPRVSRSDPAEGMIVRTGTASIEVD